MAFLPTYLPTHPVNFWESVFLVGRGLGEEVLGGADRQCLVAEKPGWKKSLLPTQLLPTQSTFGMHVHVCERKEM